MPGKNAAVLGVCRESSSVENADQRKNMKTLKLMLNHAHAARSWEPGGLLKNIHASRLMFLTTSANRSIKPASKLSP